jgi:SEC-C motif
MRIEEDMDTELDMEDGNVEISVCVTFHKGQPFIESRARAVGNDAPLPEGKILVLRTPILPPGTSLDAIEALTERELVDDDGVFCPHCAALDRPPGRNDPCPCGSGHKFKKCCLGMWRGGLN